MNLLIWNIIVMYGTAAMQHTGMYCIMIITVRIVVVSSVHACTWPTYKGIIHYGRLG